MANEIIKNDATGTIIAGATGDSYEDRARRVNAQNAAASLDKTINAGDIFCFNGAIISDGVNDKTGAACKDTFFLLPDGSALFTKSEGIYRSLKSILENFGDFLSNGIWVQLVEINTNSGNTMKALKVVPPQA